MADGIAKFWTWWKTAEPRIAAAIADEDVGSIADEITRRVHAIDRAFGWEIGGGEFALVWNGDLALRRRAQAWCAAAPKQRKWKFVPARPPGDDWEDLVMELDNGMRAELGAHLCTFAVDTERRRVDATIYHPLAGKLGDELAHQLAFVMLDRAFGEDGVERWIGSIELVTRKPRGAQPIAKLVAAVAKLAKLKDGKTFQLLQGERDGKPLLVARDAALKAIDHLACDHALTIAIAYAPDPETDGGFPTSAGLDKLEALERKLEKALGKDVAWHGRETCDGYRRIFLFVPKAAAAIARAWAKQQKPTKIAVAIAPDPAWDSLERWG